MSSGSTMVDQGAPDLGSLRLRGLLTLVTGIVLVVAAAFALTAGVGAIWHKVTATPAVAATSAAAAPASSSTASLKLLVNPAPLGGVKGPDGLVHDAFVPGALTMTAGTKYDVTVYNYDTQSHAWMLPELNIDVMVPAGSASSPSVTHFTITPKSAGTFQWFCPLPCDKWGMAHDGFMRGYLTVKS